MKKNIQYKNYFINKFQAKNLRFKFDKIFKKIKNNLDFEKDTYHFLSKNFKINFNVKELSKFKKFNTIVIIGMGGSILGSSAIYNFLKNKVKKDLIFFDDLDSKKILDFKKGNNLNRCFKILKYY